MQNTCHGKFSLYLLVITGIRFQTLIFFHREDGTGHRGAKKFPRWEYSIPTVGIFRAIGVNVKIETFLPENLEDMEEMSTFAVENHNSITK